MRCLSFKQIVGALLLSIIVAFLFAVNVVAPVSAASTKGTEVVMSSAKATIVIPTDIRIKTIPEKRAVAAYDSCLYPLEEYGYEYLCITYQSNFGYCRYEWDWDDGTEQWLGPYSSFVPIGNGQQQSSC